MESETKLLLVAFPRLQNVLSPKELSNLVGCLDRDKLLDLVHKQAKNSPDFIAENKMMNYVLMKGKFCGLRLSEIFAEGDRNYLTWLAQTNILPRDIRNTLQQFLTSWATG